MKLYMNITIYTKDNSMNHTDKTLRIGQLAKKLNVQKSVIRLWEKEFKISSTRTECGQRYFEQKDVVLFLRIKDLLYHKGYTINAAQKYIQSEYSKTYSQKEDIPLFIYKAAEHADKKDVHTRTTHNALNTQISALHNKLLKLRELL
jgi:DNA-binding transcriptional MerR regulator